MSDSVRLSVVTPVYNTSEYLSECVQSAVSQAADCDEVLLVDDGSTDGSGDICDEFAQRYPQVKAIHKENGGLSSARNAALNVARGDYIAFLDSDDWYEEGALSNIRQCLASRPDVMIGRCMLREEGKPPLREAIDSTGLDVPRGDVLQIKKALLSTRVVFMSARCVVSSGLISRHGLRFRDGVLHEDEEWTLRVCCEAQSFAFLEEPYYAYRIRNGSVMGTPTGRRTLGLWAAAEAAAGLIGRYPELTVPLRVKQSLLCARACKSYMRQDELTRAKLAERMADTPGAAIITYIMLHKGLLPDIDISEYVEILSAQKRIEDVCGQVAGALERTLRAAEAPLQHVC